jgi:nickel-dependent lactate racemase
VRVAELTNPLLKTAFPIEIDRAYVEADLKIVTGLVEPHIFCGYSGGRKAILPGIASLATIRKWHCPEIVAHAKSTPGVIRGNVAHALTTKAARIVGADFCVNVTLNRDREVTGVFAGDVEAVFAAAVRRVESYVLTRPVKPAKVILTSAAGWPLDLTFYQAIKGLVAVLPILARGGVVVLAASCDEGLGDALFESLIRCTGDVACWSRGLRSASRFCLGQWQWQRMGWTRTRGRVFLVSSLSDADARAAFTEPFADVDSAVAAALEATKSDRVIVVPEGPYVVTRAAKSLSR